MNVWLAIVIALICVCGFRKFAFRATHPAAFIVDIVLLIFITVSLSGC